MAVSENDLIVGPVVPANGVDTISLDFFFEDADWLEVYKSGSDTPLVLDTDYTVTGEGTSNGVVTLTTPANGTDTYAVYLEVPLQRSSDLQLRGGFKSDPFNVELDRVWQAMQGIKNKIERTFRLSRASASVGALEALTAAERANRVLAFGIDGQGLIVGPNPGDIVNAYQGRQYDTRAAFVADTDYAPTDGTVVTAGGVAYLRQAGADVLPGLAGWVPFGRQYARHFGAVLDGVTDDLAAVQAGIDYMDVSGVRELVFDGTAFLSATPVSAPRNVFVFLGDEGFLPTNRYPDGSIQHGFIQQGTETSYHEFRINGDTVDQPAIAGSKVNGLKVNHAFGDSSTRGGRHALYGIAIQTAVTAADNPDRNYVGVQGQVITSGGDGGTDLAAGARGAYFGFSAIANAHAGAVNIMNLTGGEVNTRVFAGASVKYKSVLQLVPKDEVQGTDFDAALAISKGGAGTIGMKTGILFGAMNGSNPIATDGTLMQHIPGAVLGRGFDFRGTTFTGPVLDAPGLSLRSGPAATGGVGASIELGSLSNADTPAIDFHSSGNNIDFDARILGSSGGSSVGNGTLSYVAQVHAFQTRLGATAGEAFRVAFNGATVNYVQATGAAAGGSGPQLQAEGLDANIDLRFIPKGTGRIRFGTYVTQADADIVGHIEVKDASGNIRKLAVVA